MTKKRIPFKETPAPKPHEFMGHEYDGDHKLTLIDKVVFVVIVIGFLITMSLPFTTL